MRHLPRPLRALLGCIALALFATACGSSTPTTETAETATAEDEATATDDATADTPIADDPATEDAEDESTTDDDHTHDEDGDHEDDDHTHDEAEGTEVDLSLFMDGALTVEPAIDECTLTDGTVTECYTITVVGTPVNHDVGPFCPTSITDDETAGGLWLDGDANYTIDGPFFTELADIYGDELWNNIFNDDGSVNVIDNAADFQVAARPDITEEFYYHCVDGDVAWLTSGEQPTTTIQVPVTPVVGDAATVQFAEGAHSTLGVTLNGAALSGSADMAAILSSYTIAAFDDCGGHINPALGYHVHGTTGCSEVGEVSDDETAPFAIAIDGHTVHEPLADDSGVELDGCNGHYSDEFGYHYHANSVEENATLTCLMGVTVEGQNAGGRPGDGERPPRPGDE